jgi:putative transcriptional regulator
MTAEAQRRTMKQWRELRGLSQMDMAKICDVSLSGIQAAEYGWHEPKVGLALKIAAALGIAVEQIVWTRHPRPGGKGEMDAA